MGLRDWFNMDRKVEQLLQKDIQERVRDAFTEVVEPFLKETGPSGASPMRSNELFKTGMQRLKEKQKRSAISYRFLTEQRSSLQYLRQDGIRIIQSPYLYDRIDAFFKKESYFSRSIQRQIETMLRNGYAFESEDAALGKILNRELLEFQMGLGIDLDQSISAMFEQVKQYGVVCVEKVRKRADNPYRSGPSQIQRIRKLRLLKPHNLLLYINGQQELIGSSDVLHQYGPLRNWNLKKQAFLSPALKAQDLVIGFSSDAGDDFYPVPPCYQMLDDILTLRSIEETVELLCMQFGSPILHVTVGTDTEPANEAEVARVHNNIVAMAPNGFFTTNSRVKADILNIQKGVANLIPYLEHFKNRVLSGSGSSPISVGEGDTANRNTAESLDDALSDHCTYMGNIICSMFHHNIIPDILTNVGVPREKLFDPRSGSLAIRMVFNEMRLEKKISRENHIMNQWNNHAITFDEMRRELRRTPLEKSEEKKLRFRMVDIPMSKAKQASNMMKGGDEPSGAAAFTKTTTQPQNQHGTKPGPGSRKN